MQSFASACLPTNWYVLTASEWASWIQAIGSIVAIAAAFLVSHRQHRKDLAREERQRREDHRADLDSKLLARTYATRNLVQVASHALDAALNLVEASKPGAMPWEAAKHVTRTEHLRVILDGLITSNTDPISVLAALGVSQVLSQTQSDMKNLGGSMSAELIERSTTRVNEGFNLLARLTGMEGKLTNMCIARGLPLEADDLR